MKAAIKLLEEIGQKTSIKEHDSLVEMLDNLDLNKESVEKIGLKTHDFVCMLFPKDDKDTNDTPDDKDTPDQQDSPDDKDTEDDDK